MNVFHHFAKFCFGCKQFVKCLCMFTGKMAAVGVEQEPALRSLITVKNRIERPPGEACEALRKGGFSVSLLHFRSGEQSQHPM